MRRVLVLVVDRRDVHHHLGFQLTEVAVQHLHAHPCEFRYLLDRHFLRLRPQLGLLRGVDFPQQFRWVRSFEVHILFRVVRQRVAATFLNSRCQRVLRLTLRHLDTLDARKRIRRTHRCEVLYACL